MKTKLIWEENIVSPLIEATSRRWIFYKHNMGCLLLSWWPVSTSFNRRSNSFLQSRDNGVWQLCERT